MRRSQSVALATTAGDPSATLIMTPGADPSDTVFMTIIGFTENLLTDPATFRREQRRTGRRSTVALEVFAGISITSGLLLMTIPVVVHSFVGQLVSLVL